MTQNSWNTPQLDVNGELLIARDSGRPLAGLITAGSATTTITNTAGNISIATVSDNAEWRKISTATASSSSSIDFTGLSATYAVYRVMGANITASSDGVNLNLRTSTDNGVSFDSGASAYQWGRIDTSTSGNSCTRDIADAQLEMAGANIGNTTNETLDFDLTCYNPSNTVFTKFTWDAVYANSASATRTARQGGGYRQSTTAVDAIRFLMSTGNIVTGDFVLYGLTA